MAHTDNVVGFWDLDSDSSDDSGNGHNGTDTSMSYDGTSGSFSGSGYITLPSSLVTWQASTLACWFNADASPAGYGNVASVGDSGGNRQTVQVGYAHAESKIYNPYGGAQAAYSGTGAWQHCVATNDGSGNMELYFNTAHTTFSTALDPGVYAGLIGKATGGWNSFVGLIRCVALYTGVKDATWASDDYNAGTPKKWADWAGGGGFINPQFPLRFAAGIGA